MITDKKKKIAGDFIYTFSALVLMNLVLQILIYPLINKYFGASYLGDVVYYTGIVYILSASFGNACSNQRLMARKLFETKNGDYLSISAVLACLIFIVYTVIMSVGEGFSLSAVLYGVSAVCIFYRYYSEVQFRLNLNFKQYLVYYVIVSIGYIFGYLLFYLLHEWSLIFIVGEGGAVLFVVFRGDIFRFEKHSENFNKLAKLIVVLAFSYVLVFIVSQYYKFFFKWMFNSEFVTKYYVTSFFGKSLDMVITPISTLIMSYLTRSKGFLSSKKLLRIILIVLLAGALLYLCFIVATPIYTKLFYPEIYNEVLTINFIVNFAQAMCAMASILSVFVLTEIGSQKYFWIQLMYVISYVSITSCLSAKLGLFGFGLGASIAYTIRFIVTALLGKRHLDKSSK